MNKKELIEYVEKELEAFSMAVHHPDNAESVIFHQDAFNENELILLGAAIKYAGYFGKNVTVVHKNEKYDKGRCDKNG
jgi:hypothetical protein